MTEGELQGELRNKLLKRLAVAGVLVAVLLGVLAFFDYLSTPSEEPEAESYNRPVPVAPRKQLTQPVTPATDLPEPPKAESVAAAPPPAATEVPAKPAVTAQPSPTAVEPVAAAKPAPSHATPAKPAASVAEGTAAPTVHTPDEPVVAARAPARVVEAPPRLSPIPGPARLGAGFTLQAGVFASAQRAEELHAKLTLNGIPSTLEARVQVGPFKTRQEADAAKEKMKALGIDAVLLPPARGPAR